LVPDIIQKLFEKVGVAIFAGNKELAALILEANLKKAKENDQGNEQANS